MAVQQHQAHTRLSAIGQGISREFRDLGTSLRARAARISASRTGVQAFIEAFSVIPQSQSQANLAAQRLGLDFKNANTSQRQTANEQRLPTSFTEVRSAKTDESAKPEQSDPPKDLSWKSYLDMRPETLDKFLEYSEAEHSAENLLFLISSEKLMSLPPGIQQKLHAIRLRQTFMDEGAPLAPNFSDKSRKAIRSLLQDLGDGQARGDLGTVLKEGQQELVKVCQDTYPRWRTSLENNQAR